MKMLKRTGWDHFYHYVRLTWPMDCILSETKLTISSLTFIFFVWTNVHSYHQSTRLICALDRLEGRDTIQRGLCRFEKWACVNLMKFKAKSCTSVRAIPSTNTGWAENRLRAATLWRRIWGCCLRRSSMWADSKHFQVGKPKVSWATWNTVWPVSQRRCLSPSALFAQSPTCSAVFSIEVSSFFKRILQVLDKAGNIYLNN